MTPTPATAPEPLLPEVLPAEPQLPELPLSVYTFKIPDGNSPAAIRARIPILKQITEQCYMRLARDLWECYHRKLYIGFGFSTFDDYVATEVGISKDRSYKLRRIFSVLVLKCDIKPKEIEAAERSRVEMILGVVNRENARDWLTRAKTLPYKALRNQLTRERAKRKSSRPAATAPDKPHPTTPVRIACEGTEGAAENATMEYQTRTFRLPDDADTLLTEALAVAQRVTRSHSDNFNLACIVQQFLSHNLTVEGKDDGRRGYFQRWMEEIYGGHFVHVRNEEAWAVLANAVDKHPHLFGTGEREDPNDHRYSDSDDDETDEDDEEKEEGGPDA
jgi:hypothetical protein